MNLIRDLALQAASQLYQWGSRLHRLRTATTCLPAPVISVGNIASGGRGKTPFVIYLAQKLKLRGWNPVVLTRGYGRQSSEAIWLRPHLAPLPGAAQTGDEAFEIFARTQIDVLVSAQRTEQAQRYLEENSSARTIFLLDDGFQHWRLHRNFDLVLVDESDFRDAVLPKGRLRETPAALQRAHLVLQRGRDFEKITQLVAPIPRTADALALTTRAPDAAYATHLRAYVPQVAMLNLEDHAPAERILSAIARRPENFLLLGAKEAAKLLPPTQYFNFLRSGAISTMLADRQWELVYVACELHIAREDLLWEGLEKALRT
ncbi:MAG: tetraacyldisaccharide 4'-kinase [Bdellovibrionales bacterium]|nr:tetraacyldisaccharide 4'-kinase [Bdellovibrionales bacterium]